MLFYTLFLQKYCMYAVILYFLFDEFILIKIKGV